LARSFPGHKWLPAPKGRKVPALGVRSCTKTELTVFLASFVYGFIERKKGFISTYIPSRRVEFHRFRPDFRI